MSVDKICNHNVVTCEADAGIVETAIRMREEHVGDVIVTEYRNGRQTPIGILTDRDLVVEVIAQQVDPSRLTVGDVMSRDPAVVRRDNGVDYALTAMLQAGVRRVPVVDQNDALVGVLSIDDVLEHLARQISHLADTLRREQSREVAQRP
jgi:signal-transduction protein with cAMP-binding, CBS, and nucleotidyltransferase domain